MDLKHFSESWRKHFPGSTEFPGAGAAGGLPVSAKSIFLHATHAAWIDFIMRWANLKKNRSKRIWIFTGEGKFDSQSLSGKVVSGIARICQNIKNVSVVCGGLRSGRNGLEGNWEFKK